MPCVRRARSRFPLWSVHLRGLQELLWEKLQQPDCDPGMSKQLPVHHRQEEQDRVQGVQAEEVPHGRHVQVRLQIWQKVQLVQDPLPHAEELATHASLLAALPLHKAHPTDAHILLALPVLAAALGDQAAQLQVAVPSQHVNRDQLHPLVALSKT